MLLFYRISTSNVNYIQNQWQKSVKTISAVIYKFQNAPWEMKISLVALFKTRNTPEERKLVELVK